MKKAKLWIESLRLSATIPAGILVHVSFILTHQKTDWLLVLEAFLVATFAMLHNDYVDRVNDLKKGRRLAFEHPNQFRIVLIVGWVIIWAIALIPLAAYTFIIPIIVISMVYSYTRKIPYLPNLLVAFASASPLIWANGVSIPIISATPNSFMFLAILSCILGREIIKDIEDAEVDVGWKRTPVSLGWFSKENEQRLACHLIGGGVGWCILATLIRISQGSIIAILIYIVGIFLCWYGSIMLYSEDTPERGKKFFDRGMLLLLLSLIVA